MPRKNGKPLKKDAARQGGGLLLRIIGEHGAAADPLPPVRRYARLRTESARRCSTGYRWTLPAAGAWTCTPAAARSAGGLVAWRSRVVFVEIDSGAPGICRRLCWISSATERSRDGRREALPRRSLGAIRHRLPGPSLRRPRARRHVQPDRAGRLAATGRPCLPRGRRCGGSASPAAGMDAAQEQASGRGGLSSGVATHPQRHSEVSWAAVRCIRDLRSFTNGHNDLVRRACRIFDHVVVAIAANPGKAPLFTLEQRMALARQVLEDVPNVEVAGYRTDGEFRARAPAERHRAGTSGRVRLRVRVPARHDEPAPSNEVETVFLTPTEQFNFISSTLIREIASLVATSASSSTRWSLSDRAAARKVAPLAGARRCANRACCTRFGGATEAIRAEHGPRGRKPMTLRDWPDAERPREKLLSSAPPRSARRSCSRSCCRPGRQGGRRSTWRAACSASSLAARPAHAERQALCKVRAWVPPSTRCLQASLELSRRHYAELMQMGPALATRGRLANTCARGFATATRGLLLHVPGQPPSRDQLRPRCSAARSTARASIPAMS